MLCSRMLTVTHDEKHGWLFNWSERMFDFARDIYVATLRVVLNYRGTVLLGSAVVLLFMGVLYESVSKGFIPRQDTGVINGITRAREGTTFKTTTERQQSMGQAIGKNANVESVLSTAGQGAGGEFGDNVGRFIIRLK